MAAVRPDGSFLPARIVAVDAEIVEWLARRQRRKMKKKVDPDAARFSAD